MLTAYKRNLWFNSDFHSGFVLNDNQKISEISFDVNPFQIDVNNNLKVITYVRDHHQSRPIQIKLKLPYNQSREVFNDDNETFPIIYVNHTGVEGMSTYYPYSVVRLVPQQIQRFTFRIDDNYNSLNGRRIEGITPDETLIQATNTNIPITIDSQYQINYQTPVVLPKGTYSATFANGNIYLDNKKFPKPWGAYFAEDWSGTILRDSSGNGRHATTAGTIYSSNLSGNGAFAPISYISGSTTSSITFPSGSIPSTFTILDLTRWTNSSDTSKQQRIINGSSTNWMQGHIASKIGDAYYTTWIADNTGYASVVTNVTDWVCTIGTNRTTGTVGGNVIANGVKRGTALGGGTSTALTINNGFITGQNSDWAMSCILIWDTALTDAQMIELNQLVNNYKETGKSLKSELWISNDYSYPILKDANGANINPFVWYQFDGSTSSLVNDASGNGYTLTNNGVTINTTNFIKGNGSALMGSGKSLGIGTTIDFRKIQTTSGFSIQLWFRGTTSSSNWGRIFAFSTSPVSENANFYISRDGSNTNIRFHLAADGTQTFYTSSGVNYFNGTWYHIVWTISTSGVWNVYINGVNLNVAKTQSFSATNNYNMTKLLGNSTLGEFLDGNIDDFRIYSSALTATQVSELYKGRLAIYNPPGFILGTEIEPEAE